MPDPSPATPASQNTGTARATLRALLAIVLFTYVAQNMLNVSIAPLARVLGLREWIVGLAVSLAALTVASLSQFWGRRSIAWGRRRVLLSALTLAMIAGCLFAGAVRLRTAGLLGAAATAVAVVVARGPFFGGAVAAIPPTGQALIAEMTPDERARVKGMAAFAGSVQLSIVIGSVVSSALGAWSILAPVYATPVFVAIALAIGLARIPHDGARPRPARGGSPALAPDSGEPASPGEPATARAPEPARALPPRVSWHDHRLLPWIASGLGMFFSAGVVQIIVGFIVQDRLGLPPQRAVSLTAVMLLANAAGAMLMQLVAVPRLGWSPQRLLRAGLTTAVIALSSLALAPSLPIMAASTFFLGIAMGLVGPGFTAGGSLAVSAAEQGGVAGILNATGAVTWIFAPVTATALYGWQPLAPFVLALAVLSASTAVAWAHPRMRAARP